MPKMNITQWPFLSVMNPHVNNSTRYNAAPKPIPHHMA
jgi:hypothetical protein